MQSATIVQPLRRLERPFKESVVVEYNLWKPGNENQMLELAIRYYLELFREITRDQRWKDDFRVDLVARAIFDNIGNRASYRSSVLRLKLGAHTATNGIGSCSLLL